MIPIKKSRFYKIIKQGIKIMIIDWLITKYTIALAINNKHQNVKIKLESQSTSIKVNIKYK